MASSEIKKDQPARRGISFDQLSKWRDFSISNRIVTILDCCFSGSDELTKGGTSEDEAANLGRKDMEIYGLTGAIYADNRHDIRLRKAEGYDGFKEYALKLVERKAPLDDPFAFLAAVIREERSPDPYSLSSLENNLIVMEILDAAIRSAKTGQTIYLKD